ncbi:AraC family transcriptional regulator [Paraburkholderia sp. CNPSo 3272]|uniref:helix-turn-helix domain-containing protein n=1 Tax=Paraburkholderia sp. CNPSo 3272 TaxID=2940931 RepID=UPI0020B87B87|nr:AraC family transcriptional regulator [Paraburkholderia sp. CNPSo 3272]MCP3728149.1 AraC family transcriptional regulator [Paraburkholderia sp. CNPSo 3272]
MSSLCDWNHGIGSARLFTDVCCSADTNLPSSDDFREPLGNSFVAWREQACLIEAVARLTRGESVTLVAYESGYGSPAAFSTMFKRVMSVSPQRYLAASERVSAAAPLAKLPIARSFYFGYARRLLLSRCETVPPCR